MTKRAQKLLEAFTTLTPVEQQQVAAEMLRKATSNTELSHAALDELANELFGCYDAEEAALGQPVAILSKAK
jgi:hypothetical protein